LTDPIGRVSNAVFRFAFILHISPGVVALLGLVIDLRLIVLLGDFRLKVGVTVLQIE
jgi:hypothetical protein